MKKGKTKKAIKKIAKTDKRKQWSFAMVTDYYGKGNGKRAKFGNGAIVRFQGIKAVIVSQLKNGVRILLAKAYKNSVRYTVKTAQLKLTH